VTPILEIKNLRLALAAAGEWREILRDVCLQLDQGESLALVGESGSGKSMTARSTVRLMPAGARFDGEIRFDGESVLGMSAAELRRYRANDVAMIFQDPRATINPLRRIGDFLTEGLVVNQGVTRAVAEAQACELLTAVRIPDARRRLRQYPHELSGGLLQRVMIAAALTGRPRLLLADEPTTALDVTTQAEVVAVLADLRREFKLALLFITHDLELAAATCDRTAVMYAGAIVEEQRSATLHARPGHPYSAALVASRPPVEYTTDRRPVIRGTPVSAADAPPGCPFEPRCDHAAAPCAEARPSLDTTADGGAVACFRAGELRANSALLGEPMSRVV
jgi:oligopeptide/dipeptide ABC transporter ATP-binding protein